MCVCQYGLHVSKFYISTSHCITSGLLTIGDAELDHPVKAVATELFIVDIHSLFVINK